MSIKAKYTKSVFFTDYPSYNEFILSKQELYHKLVRLINNDDADLLDYDFHNIYVKQVSWGFEVVMEAVFKS